MSAKAVPWTHARGPRPREWFGKAEPRKDPGTELGTDQHGNDGKTDQGRKWRSYNWWMGHHMARAADGSWSTWDGMGKAPAGNAWANDRKASTLPTSKAKPETRASRHAAAQVEYTAHLHRQYMAAEAATNGNMATAAGKAKGYGGPEFFAFSTAHRPSRRYMSDELKAFLRDGNAAASDNTIDATGLMTFASWQRAKKDTKQGHDRGPWTNRTRTR